MLNENNLLLKINNVAYFLRIQLINLFVFKIIFVKKGNVLRMLYLILKPRMLLDQKHYNYL